MGDREKGKGQVCNKEEVKGKIKQRKRMWKEGSGRYKQLRKVEKEGKQLTVMGDRRGQR